MILSKYLAFVLTLSLGFLMACSSFEPLTKESESVRPFEQKWTDSGYVSNSSEAITSILIDDFSDSTNWTNESNRTIFISKGEKL